MAIIGRMLESQGFRVGIISQPDWKTTEDFMKLGKPNLFFGVTAGNMDSMINRYTAERRMRHDDAYTPNDEGGKRPDRAVTAYTQKCKQAFKGVPVIIGGIEASLRRIAHYDYWSDKVRRSVLFDSKADLLVYGNAERPLIEIAHRLANGEEVKKITNVRGSAFLANQVLPGWQGIDSRDIDRPGKIEPIPNPYDEITPTSCSDNEARTANNESEDVTKTAQVINIADGDSVSSLDNKDGVMWVNGTPDVSMNGGSYGSADHPAALIINGNLNVTGNPEIYGVLYVVGQLDAGGTVKVIGSTIVEGDTAIVPAGEDPVVGTGGVDLTYSPFTQGLSPNGIRGTATVISGSWRDW